jgi:ATP-dependent RNA helicase RhlE
LIKAGIAAEAIHGNKSQGQRERVLAAFRKGTVRTLVATDIAARGIDVDGISHVVNFDLPDVPETYVHRIGRTARAGAEGIAISLCDAEEATLLRDIEKLIRQSIPATDRRTGPSRAEPTNAPNHAAQRSNRFPGNRRQRRGGDTPHAHGQHRGGDAPHAHGQHEQAGEASRGIASVAFLRRPAQSRHEDAPRARRWPNHSKGS